MHILTAVRDTTTLKILDLSRVVPSHQNYCYDPGHLAENVGLVLQVVTNLNIQNFRHSQKVVLGKQHTERTASSKKPVRRPWHRAIPNRHEAQQDLVVFRPRLQSNRRSRCRTSVQMVENHSTTLRFECSRKRNQRLRRKVSGITFKVYSVNRALFALERLNGDLPASLLVNLVLFGLIPMKIVYLCETGLIWILTEP